MVSAKLRGRNMRMKREERDRRTGSEIHKMDKRCELQNARLYDQKGITEREAQGKGKDKSFKVRRKVKGRKRKGNSKKECEE